MLIPTRVLPHIFFNIRFPSRHTVRKFSRIASIPLMTGSAECAMSDVVNQYRNVLLNAKFCDNNLCGLKESLTTLNARINM